MVRVGWRGEGNAGLASVGPPPSLRMSQLLASCRMTGSTVQRDRGPEHRAVELTGPVLVSDDQEVGEHEPGGRGRELSVCHGKPPSRLILPAGIATAPARGRLGSGGAGWAARAAERQAQPHPPAANPSYPSPPSGPSSSGAAARDRISSASPARSASEAPPAAAAKRISSAPDRWASGSRSVQAAMARAYDGEIVPPASAGRQGRVGGQPAHPPHRTIGRPRGDLGLPPQPRPRAALTVSLIRRAGPERGQDPRVRRRLRRLRPGQLPQALRLHRTRQIRRVHAVQVGQPSAHRRQRLTRAGW